MRIQNKIMLGAVIFVLCAAAAYAQVSISSIPVTTVRTGGRAELAGSVRVAAGAGGTGAGDTFTITYSDPITDTNGASGILLDASSTWATCSVSSVVNSNANNNGVVTVVCTAGAGANQYFQVDGVRITVDGYPSYPVNATIGALVTPITAGQSQAVVVESIAAALVDGQTTTTKNSSMTFLANGTNIGIVASKFYLKEGFASAVKTITDEGLPSATQSTQILLTVSGLPAGVTVALTNGVTTSATLTPTFSNATFSSTATTSLVSFSADSLSAVESLELDFTTTVGATATLPLTATTYSVAAQLYPNAAALSATGGVVTPFVAPKFSPTAVSFTSTILTIAPATTNLLIPFSSTQANYDTAIAIANTTTDPYTVGGATPQSGTITFYFYPNDGTTISSYTTSATSPGSGLSTTGVLTTGSTYAVSLIKLLGVAAPTRTAPFSGYIIAVVNATNCHGISYITNYSGFTSFSPLLLLPTPAVTARTFDEKLTF